MRKLIESVNSLNHLVAFEASSRLLSFTEAAKELNVSQPAVSQSVRKLEQSLGVELFQRHHRKISLTDAGERLCYGVKDGFSRIQDSVEQIQQTNLGKHVTLSVSTAFANYWMVPRLGAFHKLNPHIDLRLQTTDKDVDLIGEGLSLGVRRGYGDFPGYDHALIAREILFPIGSPTINQSSKANISPQELSQCELIHLEEPFRPRPTWKDWFSAFDIKVPGTDRGLRLNDYALVIQAAMAGEGIAIGWEHTVSKLIEQGLLVRIGQNVWETGANFYLIWRNTGDLSDDARIVRDWIIGTANA